MMSTKHILNLCKVLKEFMQPTIFSADDAPIKEACVAYLRYNGYTVNEPIVHKNNARKLEDIPAHFYVRLRSILPENSTPTYQNFGRDMALAKGMVNNRMDTTGVSREIAIKECYAIIDAFFDNIREFNLKGPIRFELFGQKNMAWVTDKTIQIMNKNTRIKEEKDFEVYLDKVSKKAEEVDDFSYDLDKILKKIKEKD